MIRLSIILEWTMLVKRLKHDNYFYESMPSAEKKNNSNDVALLSCQKTNCVGSAIKKTRHYNKKKRSYKHILMFIVSKIIVETPQ